jgi:hypothetical protein
MLYSVRDYVCDLYYVSNVIHLGGPLREQLARDPGHLWSKQNETFDIPHRTRPAPRVLCSEVS